MDNSWLILVIVLLAAVLGVMLRNRFFAAGTPFRRWTDSRLAPLAAKAAKIFCFATLAIWLALWVVADADDRTRLNREFKSLIQSMEWGKKDVPPSKEGKQP